MKASVIAVLLVIAIAAGTGTVYALYRENQFSGACSITGQPNGIELRVLSDSALAPVRGVQVKATNLPAHCGESQATQQRTTNFTTTSKEWYSLPSNNNVGYSFVITYSSQTYNITASLSPITMTCATLFIPSGQSNVTMTEYNTSC